MKRSNRLWSTNSYTNKAKANHHYINISHENMFWFEFLPSYNGNVIFILMNVLIQSFIISSTSKQNSEVCANLLQT